MTCNHPECTEDAVVRGLCNLHYAIRRDLIAAHETSEESSKTWTPPVQPAKTTRKGKTRG